jgi:biotin carboxyl carrier protein
MEVRAPMAGKIFKVEIAAGATIEEDDEMFVIEVMKMEVRVYAPCSGTVSGIQVKEGDKVEEDQVMATID